MKIIIDRASRYREGIAFPTVIVREIGLDFKTYERLVSIYPGFKERLTDVIGSQIFCLEDQTFIRSFKNATTSKGLRFFIELNLQRILLKNAFCLKDPKRTALAKLVGVDKNTVKRVVDIYPVFSLLLKNIKSFKELKETYFGEMPTLKYSSGIPSADDTPNDKISEFISSISNFSDSAKLFSIFYFLNRWLEKEYYISCCEYRVLVEYLYALTQRILAAGIERPCLNFNTSNNLEQSYNRLFEKYINKIGENFSLKEFSIALLLHSLTGELKKV